MILISNQISKDVNDIHNLKSYQNRFPDSNSVILDFESIFTTQVQLPM